jgi:hypothetical protein
MKRLIRLFRQTELHVFLFVLGFVSLNWPILSIFHGGSSVGLFVYFLLVWSLIIVLLFLINRACSEDVHQSPQDEPY